jgi:hypothetical protein
LESSHEEIANERGASRVCILGQACQGNWFEDR